jgi:uroporphyrinogen-III synthase
VTEHTPRPPTEPDFGHDDIVSLQNPPIPQSGLSGKHVVITRAPHQSETLADLLRQANALPLFYPCIDIAPPEDTTPLDETLRRFATFDWLILTSANTVYALANRLDTLGLPLSSLAQLQVAAVGPATAIVARELLSVDAVVPSSANSDEYSAEAMARNLQLLPGSRVLLPQSEIASPALAEVLAQQGADVQVVTAYRTIRGSGGDPVPQLLTNGEVDAITFTSSSTVQYFLERLAAEGGSNSQLANVTIACIGESTAQVARDAGFTVSIIPSTSTLPALVRSLEAYFDAR